MKKLLIILCTAAIALTLGACGSNAGSSASPNASASADASSSSASQTAVPSFATLGDAFAVEADSSSYAYSDEGLAYAYEHDGTQVRVTADMTKEVYDACDKISYDDPEHDAKVRAELSSLPVKSVEDLTKSAVPQSELDGFVGKTGKDLLDNGFTNPSFLGADGECQFYMDNGYHQYTVVFNEAAPADAETADAEQTIAPLTVKSISYMGLSSAASDPDASAV